MNFPFTFRRLTNDQVDYRSDEFRWKGFIIQYDTEIHPEHGKVLGNIRDIEGRIVNRSIVTRYHYAIELVEEKSFSSYPFMLDFFRRILSDYQPAQIPFNAIANIQHFGKIRATFQQYNDSDDFLNAFSIIQSEVVKRKGIHPDSAVGVWIPKNKIGKSA